MNKVKIERCLELRKPLQRKRRSQCRDPKLENPKHINRVHPANLMEPIENHLSLLISGRKVISQVPVEHKNSWGPSKPMADHSKIKQQQKRVTLQRIITEEFNLCKIVICGKMIPKDSTNKLITTLKRLLVFPMIATVKVNLLNMRCYKSRQKVGICKGDWEKLTEAKKKNFNNWKLDIIHLLRALGKIIMREFMQNIKYNRNMEHSWVICKLNQRRISHRQLTAMPQMRWRIRWP